MLPYCAKYRQNGKRLLQIRTHRIQINYVNHLHSYLNPLIYLLQKQKGSNPFEFVQSGKQTASKKPSTYRSESVNAKINLPCAPN